MEAGGEQADPGKESGRRGAEEETRPQQGGEAATTRFGMEEGDNADVPATGEGTRDEEA